jgi:hypothetical protein
MRSIFNHGASRTKAFLTTDGQPMIGSKRPKLGPNLDLAANLKNLA